ncbi:hypothetical protein GCM10028808_57000 [Spirosoma migulaei]
MALRQMVTGFFEHVAEAQQAVQLLLGSGFTREALSMNTQPTPILPTVDNTSLPQSGFTDGEIGLDKPTSGHFLFSLFGNVDESGHGPFDRDENDSGTSAQANSLRSLATVTVRIRSTAEAKRATELLRNAGAKTA